MAGEVNRLIASPEQRTMRLNAAEPCPHEENDLTGAAAFLDRPRVDSGPQNGPRIVSQHSIQAGSQTHVDRQILPEVSHPAAQPKIQHIAPNHTLLKPFRGSRVGE